VCAVPGEPASDGRGVAGWWGERDEHLAGRVCGGGRNKGAYGRLLPAAPNQNAARGTEGLPAWCGGTACHHWSFAGREGQGLGRIALGGQLLQGVHKSTAPYTPLSLSRPALSGRAADGLKVKKLTRKGF
jgi:hypothetical protein